MEGGKEQASALPADPAGALEALVASMARDSPDELSATLEFLGESGGQIVWDPSTVDPSGFVAIQTTHNLLVGSRWLTRAADDPVSVHSNIQHEIGGHLSYGHSLSCRIVEHALVGTDDVDRQALFFELAYPESEIYAELKELPLRGPTSMGDAPRADIAERINQIREGFPTGVAEVLLASMQARFRADRTLAAEARNLFESLLAENA